MITGAEAIKFALPHRVGFNTLLAVLKTLATDQDINLELIQNFSSAVIQSRKALARKPMDFYQPGFSPIRECRTDAHLFVKSKWVLDEANKRVFESRQMISVSLKKHTEAEIAIKRFQSLIAKQHNDLRLGQPK